MPTFLAPPAHVAPLALFRYGRIADLLHLPPGTHTLHARLREKADRELRHPGHPAPTGGCRDAARLALRLPARGLRRLEAPATGRPGHGPRAAAGRGGS